MKKKTCRARTRSGAPGVKDPRERPNQARPDFSDDESQRVLSEAAGDVAYALGELAAEAYFRALLERKAS